MRCPCGIVFGYRRMGGRCLQLEGPIEEKQVTIPLFVIVRHFCCQLGVVLHNLQLVGKGPRLE